LMSVGEVGIACALFLRERRSRRAASPTAGAAPAS